MSSNLHSLLKRQLKQYFGERILSDEFKPFIDAVNKAYLDFDADRNILERSLEYSSQELLRANADMQAIFQAFPDILFRIDADGKILNYEPGSSENLEFFEQNLAGKHIHDLPDDTVRKLFLENIEKIKNAKTMRSVEYTIAAKGQNAYFEARFVSLTEDQVIIIIRNITERKQVEGSQKRIESEIKVKNESLKKNEKALRNMLVDLKKVHDDLKSTQGQLIQSEKLASIGQLAAGVAHEINNPVGFISNNMEVLREYIQHYTKILQIIDGLKKEIEKGDIGKARLTIEELKKFEEEINLGYIMDDVHKLLEHSGRGLERIRKIVLDLRTFAREDKAEAMESVKIEEVIDSILSIAQNEIKYKAELTKHYGDTPLIHCNPQRLGQVFINLLVNASQAIVEKGKINIRTYQNEGWVCVEISDTGKGISEENLKKIFDPFFTTKPVGQGTGLGLSVSYEIVKTQGGEIKVESEVGKGATFTVMLPV